MPTPIAKPTMKRRKAEKRYAAAPLVRGTYPGGGAGSPLKMRALTADASCTCIATTNMGMKNSRKGGTDEKVTYHH
ncbi:hypothetical protein DQ04_21721000 [Trypanosoma grayi]|uniref:hypothetical protein n=1 Tax=Trypanosoma grayi TaxID=71804 RepID=UPI0004F45F71|nr:hypothetical protein DQ04_21721000 [Trypanosoma grayi]KEG05463.1 hypothetical protein DQ04_21721000 [Trypanosoma grayi]